MTIILSLIAGAVVGGGAVHWWHKRHINLSVSGGQLATKDGATAASAQPTNGKPK